MARRGCRTKRSGPSTPAPPSRARCCARPPACVGRCWTPYAPASPARRRSRPPRWPTPARPHSIGADPLRCVPAFDQFDHLVAVMQRRKRTPDRADPAPVATACDLLHLVAPDVDHGAQHLAAPHVVTGLNARVPEAAAGGLDV